MKATVARRPAVPALHARFNGSNERIVGRDNHINAGYNKNNQVTAADVQTRNQKLSAAFYTQNNSRPWANMGAAVSADLSEAADREGFMRRLLLKVDVANGTIPRIRVKQKNIIALIASSGLDNRPVYLRDKYITPPEFYIKHNIRVEEREIVQGSGDILEDKFFETQEGIMVQEDRKFISLLNDTIGIANSNQLLAGGLSPATLSQMRTQILQWNLPASTLLIASDVLNDIVGQGANTFGGYFDPVSQFEIVQTGMIGTLMGMQVITDSYRAPTLKVLNAGDIWVLSNPEMLGAFTDRGPVQSQEVNSYMEGSPARGWNFFELLSMTITNQRSAVHGSRV